VRGRGAVTRQERKQVRLFPEIAAVLVRACVCEASEYISTIERSVKE